MLELMASSTLPTVMASSTHTNFANVGPGCRMAEIRDMIVALPRGYQAEIGERGVGLSGGQKQHLASARALLKPLRILILTKRPAAWTAPRSTTLRPLSISFTAR